ncbi:hypothetical protein DFH09DRAFT_1327781 [Mycena vulgaris]|nr:hypothetical protein DFH09DRAFT_1327781 [Mycena vulgaris]
MPLGTITTVDPSSASNPLRSRSIRAYIHQQRQRFGPYLVFIGRPYDARPARHIKKSVPKTPVCRQTPPSYIARSEPPTLCHALSAIQHGWVDSPTNYRLVYSGFGALLLSPRLVPTSVSAPDATYESLASHAPPTPPPLPTPTPPRILRSEAHVYAYHLTSTSDEPTDAGIGFRDPQNVEYITDASSCLPRHFSRAAPSTPQIPEFRDNPYSPLLLTAPRVEALYAAVFPVHAANHVNGVEMASRILAFVPVFEVRWLSPRKSVGSPAFHSACLRLAVFCVGSPILDDVSI